MLGSGQVRLTSTKRTRMLGERKVKQNGPDTQRTRMLGERKVGQNDPDTQRTRMLGERKVGQNSPDRALDDPGPEKGEGLTQDTRGQVHNPHPEAKKTREMTGTFLQTQGVNKSSEDRRGGSVDEEVRFPGEEEKEAGAREGRGLVAEILEEQLETEVPGSGNSQSLTKDRLLQGTVAK